MRLVSLNTALVRVTDSPPNAPLLVHLEKASTEMERFQTLVQNMIGQAHTSQGSLEGNM